MSGRNTVINHLKKVVSLTMELQVDQIEQILNSKKDKMLIEKFENFDNRLKKIEITLDQMIEALKEKKMIQLKKLSKESLSEQEMSEKFIKTINLLKSPNNSHQSSALLNENKTNSEVKYFEDINLKMQNLLTLKSKLSEYAMKFDKMKFNAGKPDFYHLRNEQPEARKVIGNNLKCYKTRHLHFINNFRTDFANSSEYLYFLEQCKIRAKIKCPNTINKDFMILKRNQ